MSILTYIIKRSKKFIPLFWIIFICDFIYHLLLSIAISFYDPSLIETFEKGTPLKEIFLLSVIIGPLLETLIFQYLTIEILSFFKLKKSFIILISSLFFSLIHYYNFIYIIATLPAGIIYATYYMYLKEKKIKTPFLYIFGLHTLYNFTVFILDDILGW